MAAMVVVPRGIPWENGGGGGGGESEIFTVSFFKI